MGIRGEVFSKKVILPNRTYFFNIKENRLGDLYLNMVESKNRDAGGFERQSIVLFADDLQEFLKAFDESLQMLEDLIRKQRRGGGSRIAKDSERTSSDEKSSDSETTGGDEQPNTNTPGSWYEDVYKKPARSEYKPRERKRSDSGEYAPRERKRSDSGEYAPRERKRTERGEYTPREHKRSDSGEYAPREYKRTERSGFASRERKGTDRGSYSSGDRKKSFDRAPYSMHDRKKTYERESSYNRKKPSEDGYSYPAREGKRVVIRKSKKSEE